MATYEKTIIIESNKQSAVAAAKTSDDSSLYDKDDTIDDGKHRWETYIPDGLPLEVGDTINLESSMINAVGGGDSVIELTGFTGETINSLKIRDNKMKISMSFYVTNAQQFNFNLPKDRHQCCYNVKKQDLEVMRIHTEIILMEHLLPLLIQEIIMLIFIVGKNLILIRW